MQKNYFVHALALLALAGIFLAFVFARIQYELFLSNEIMIKKNKDFHDQIAFNRFACSFSTTITNDPVLQSIKYNRYDIDKNYVPKSLTLLPIAYSNIPSNAIYVHSGVKQPVISMLSQAKKEGVLLGVNSGYRDFARQKRIYQNPINHSPSHEYDRAARPGYSEHQLGTAVDISAPLFANQYTINKGYAWLAQNAHNYGFVLSYPKGSEAITGFRYEPWHHRYVGKEIATELKAKGELFNETTDAFHTDPFEPEQSVRHAFLPENMYVGLIASFGNKTIISEDFLGKELSTKEIQDLVSNITQESTGSTVLSRQVGTSTQELDFETQRDELQIREGSYKRLQARAQLDDDLWLFADIVYIPRLHSQMLFAYTAEFQQSDILQTYVLENCK